MSARSAGARLAPVLGVILSGILLWDASVDAQATRGAFGSSASSPGRSSVSAPSKSSASSNRATPRPGLPNERLQSSGLSAPITPVAPGHRSTDLDTRRLSRPSGGQKNFGTRDFGAWPREGHRWVDSRRHIRFRHPHFGRRGRFFVIHVPGVYSTWGAWSYYPVTPYSPWRVYPYVDSAGMAMYADGAETQAPEVTHTTAPGERDRLAPFDPAPQEVVERMLTLAGLSTRDVLYDLGSGDGRVVIAAAKHFGVRAVGMEIDPGLVRLARENVRREGVENLVEIRQGDFMAADLSPATVVTLYLSHQGNVAVRPKLFRELKPGARVVSYAFDMAEWQPKIAETYRDAAGAGHILYLWEVSDPFVFSNRTP